jgi:hypothetical protein
MSVFKKTYQVAKVKKSSQGLLTNLIYPLEQFQPRHFQFLNLLKHLFHLFDDRIRRYEDNFKLFSRDRIHTYLRKIPVTGFDFPACDDTPIGNASCPSKKYINTIQC